MVLVHVQITTYADLNQYLSYNFYNFLTMFLHTLYICSDYLFTYLLHIYYNPYTLLLHIYNICLTRFYIYFRHFDNLFTYKQYFFNNQIFVFAFELVMPYFSNIKLLLLFKQNYIQFLFLLCFLCNTITICCFWLWFCIFGDKQLLLLYVFNCFYIFLGKKNNARKS